MSLTRYEGEIQTYANADIEKTVALANGQLKLHLLLMLNCGMTQKDVSDLLKSQIDLKAGIISRKRSKTKDKVNTPKVSYQLWPSTLAELTKHMSKLPGLRALTTKSGQAWCRKETTESGKIKKADNIATLWSNFKKANPDAKFLKTLKALKKSSSSLLRNSKFAEFHEYFLGHSEKTISGRNYSKLDQNDFKAAIAWLGEQYGVAKVVKAETASPVTPSP